MEIFISVSVLVIIALIITGFILYKTNCKVEVFGIPIVFVLGLIGILVSVICYVIIQRAFGNKRDLVEELESRLQKFETEKAIEDLDDEMKNIDKEVENIDKTINDLDTNREENESDLITFEKKRDDIVKSRNKLEEHKRSLKTSLEERVNKMNQRYDN